MAKLLQSFWKQLLRFWQFIGTFFTMISSHLRRVIIYEIDIEGLLQWHKEEVSRLQAFADENEVLNKNQFKHTLGKLKDVVESVGEMITLTSEAPKFGIVLEELFCITQKLGVMVNKCGDQHSAQAIVFQINVKEDFREFVSHFSCCWDVMCDIYSSSDSKPQREFLIDFNIPTLKDIEGDEDILKERLKSLAEDTSKKEWTDHLQRRLRDSELEGGELDDVEVPIVSDLLKPGLQKQIGEGGHGEVYQSIWMGFQCATKILPVGRDSATKILPAAFRREVGILAGLSHPNLIKFIYCGSGERVDELCSSALKREDVKNSEYLYLVMEFMDMSLSDMLKKQPLPYLVAIDIMHQIASGMCYLHDMHVSHLDLKPANVLLSCCKYSKERKFNSSQLLVKLADYGSSKIEVQSKVSEEQTFVRGGTIKYISPEEMKRHLGKNTSFFQADVWSFAMICSEILSRNVPFNTNDILKDILEKIKDFERPELPMNCEELTRLIEECWVEDPLQRPMFSEICEKLIDLKRKFLRGTYSSSLFPKFQVNGALLQKKSRIEKSEEVKVKRDVKVREATMQVNDKVVGHKRNLEKVTDRLKQERILGLIGMGGIGKTTLANAIFNDVKSAYNASCFAKDLKDKNDSFGILCDMLKDFQVDSRPTNPEDAQNMLKQFLVDKKKVLIILDDIKDEAQLDDLIHPDILSENKGITLIITTRHWDTIKDRIGENGKIQIETLDQNGAKELFNFHSCGSGGSLPIGFHEISERIVEACNGLPLSLRVLGAYLWDKKRLRSWERALRRIKRGRCLDGDREVENMKLWSTLKISFEGLDIVGKNKFLDIACFFCKDVWPSGLSKDRALHVWTDYDVPPIKTLNMLIDRSLINIDRNGCIEMHDQLRDMGRMIVERYKEYMGIRVGSVGLIPSTQLTSKVHTLAFNHLNDNLDLKLNNLRLLIFHLDGHNKSIDLQPLEVLLSKISRHSCQLKTIIINNYPSTIRRLHLPHLPQQLEDNSLKTIDMEGGLRLKTIREGFENLSSLTTLDLEGCSMLTTLPEGFGNLTSLKIVNLRGCSSLTTLPEGLGNLISLKIVYVRGCSSLTTLPERLGNLISLTTLDLRYCLSLRTLPEGLGNLTSLTTLDLGGCSSLTTLPEGLENLTSLTTLDLGGCSSLTTLPEGLGNLTSLTTLDLGGCSSLTTLFEGLENLISLTTLHLLGYSSLTTLPEGLGNLTSLTTFHLWECSSLTTLPEGLENLISLTTLDLRGCSSLTTLPEGFGNLILLKTVNLRGCSSLTTLPKGFGNLISLATLHLLGCSRLITLPEGLGNLTSLTTLHLRGCSSLTTLPEGLGNLISLITLHLWGCSSLTTLPKGLGNLTSLTTLDLLGCSSLTTLPEGLENLISFTTLDLLGCSSLTTLPEGFGNLTSLTTLDLRGCSSLITLPDGLGNLTSLTTLHLWGCSRLTTLPKGLENLISLTTLHLRGCSRLTTLPEGLGNLTSLPTLHLRGCSSLTTLPEGLGNLISLTTLDLRGCSSLITLPDGFGNLISLTTLHLWGCSRLTTLPEGLGNLTSLTTLDLRGCSSLTTLPEGLGNLTSLTTLHLRGCSSLTTLPEGLGNLTSLTTLDLRGCSSLTTLSEGFGNLTSLTTLDLKYCSSLRTLPEGFETSFL